MTPSHSLYILKVSPSLSGHFSEKCHLVRPEWKRHNNINLHPQGSLTSLPKNPKVTGPQSKTHTRARAKCLLWNAIIFIVQTRVKVQRKEDRDGEERKDQLIRDRGTRSGS